MAEEEEKSKKLDSVSNLDIEISAEAQVKRTESRDKVSDAILKLFPGGHGELITTEQDRVMFVSSNMRALQYLKDQFRDRRVRAAARRLLLSNQGEENGLTTFLLLNKQAATVAIGALCDDPKESPLGPIVLRMRSEKLQSVIDWMTKGYEGATS